MSIPGVCRSLFDQSCNLLRVGYVDTVTGACDFHFVAVGSCGIPPFEFGVDGFLSTRCAVRRHLHQAGRKARPRSVCRHRGRRISAHLEKAQNAYSLTAPKGGRGWDWFLPRLANAVATTVRALITIDLYYAGRKIWYDEWEIKQEKAHE
jgi:hypothetical protein